MPEFHLTAKKTQDSELVQIKDPVNIFIHNDDVLLYVTCSGKLKNIDKVSPTKSSEKISVPLIFPGNKLGYIDISLESFNKIIAYINQDLKENEQFNPKTVIVKAYHIDIDMKSNVPLKQIDELKFMKTEELKELIKPSPEEIKEAETEEAEEIQISEDKTKKAEEVQTSEDKTEEAEEVQTSEDKTKKAEEAEEAETKEEGKSKPETSMNTTSANAAIKEKEKEAMSVS